MAAAEINGNRVEPHKNGTVPKMNGSTSYAAKHNIADHFIGGNRLEVASAGPVKDFVASHDGHTVITNVCTVNYFPGEKCGAAGTDEAQNLGPYCEQWNCSS
jgi:hypothetical protein